MTSPRAQKTAVAEGNSVRGWAGSARSLTVLPLKSNIVCKRAQLGKYYVLMQQPRRSARQPLLRTSNIESDRDVTIDGIDSICDAPIATPEAQKLRPLEGVTRPESEQ